MSGLSGRPDRPLQEEGSDHASGWAESSHSSSDGDDKARKELDCNILQIKSVVRKNNRLETHHLKQTDVCS